MGRMGRIARALVVTSVVLVGLVAPASAAAFDLDTCTLTVTSKDASGAVIDSATGGGPGGTVDDPLTVDLDGSVEWQGSDGGADLEGASWHVEIYGVPTPLRGEDRPGDDPGSDGTGRGTIKVGDFLPFELVGVIFVSGAVEIGGQPVCAGAGWIELPGDASATPAFIGAGVIALIGAGLVLSALRGRHIVRGGFGGILAGGGLATLTAIEGVLPFDKDTPAAVMIGSVLVGIAMGAIDVGSLFGGRKPPVPSAPANPPVSSAESAPSSTPVESGSAIPAETPSTPSMPQTPDVPEAPSATAPEASAAEAPTAPETPPVEVPAVPEETPTAEAPEEQASDAAADPATPTETPAQKKLREALDALPDEVRPRVKEIIAQAEQTVMSGGNEVTVSAEELTSLAKGYTSLVKGVKLGDGIIEADAGGLGTARIDPGVDADDRVVVSVKGLLAGNGTVGRTLASLLNTIGDALAERGHRIAGIIVEPSGMTIQTEPITPPGG